ncbi:NADH-quinone oxidoreductase subunit C [Streptomyces sp. B6B3]|uniref:NADH-quinone oxidoreductase subunit C n=1 Tax=Streptomyces sp. B6B3 TaxID=3153570 RepID=UPI00325C8309
MTGVGWLPRDAADLFGEGAEATESYGLLTVDVPVSDDAERWPRALLAARDELGCSYFDWLSAVDEPGTGFQVCAHVVALGAPPRTLLLRTTLPHAGAAVPTATGVYPGAAWHERETHEMFGIDFPGHPGLTPLLLPDTFEGHPLRKDFVLAARVVKAWPGAKEPGESAHGGPRRRQMLPPGVPDPNEWGPLKGQLPDAPARPARARGAADRGDRPTRRTRSASEGSASQRDSAAPGETPDERPTRRARSASEGSASQRESAAPGETPDERPTRRARSGGDGAAPASGESPGRGRPPGTAAGRRAADTPWQPPVTPPPGAKGSAPAEGRPGSAGSDEPPGAPDVHPGDAGPVTPPPGAAGSAPAEDRPGPAGSAARSEEATPDDRPGDAANDDAHGPVTPPPGVEDSAPAEDRPGPAGAPGLDEPPVAPGEPGTSPASDDARGPVAPSTEDRPGPAGAAPRGEGAGPGRQPRGGPRAGREADDETDTDGGSDAANGGESGEGGG